jgi:hypothetical protein
MSACAVEQLLVAPSPKRLDQMMSPTLGTTFLIWETPLVRRVRRHQLPHPRTIVSAHTEIAAITLHIDTYHGPTTSNVIPPTISIHKDQRRYIVNDARRRPTAAEHCRHLAEFAGNLPVVMELDHYSTMTCTQRSEAGSAKNPTSTIQK